MEPGTGTFSEEQFREACAELQRPALSGAAWELLMETQGISVYGLLDQPTGLYEYKLIGTLRAPPDILADICMDLGYIRRRIPQVTEAYETECDGETVTYMKMEFPFLLSSRDIWGPENNFSFRAFTTLPQSVEEEAGPQRVKVTEAHSQAVSSRLRDGTQAPRFQLSPPPLLPQHWLWTLIYLLLHKPWWLDSILAHQHGCQECNSWLPG
ncbi:phosphatidylcholine transfer protein-like isoform X1 [Bos taurus]|uniref:phosphatidylcholine transfer protein-like isoform X1 n=1 Tax=Bos taurus TaxID=9913 RepID=UPI0028CB17B5|nr:phosphatidylcholine transfer protein-like isoform X1 [Bos taurus]